jgi:hypothetical protein
MANPQTLIKAIIRGLEALGATPDVPKPRRPVGTIPTPQRFESGAGQDTLTDSLGIRGSALDDNVRSAEDLATIEAEIRKITKSGELGDLTKSTSYDLEGNVRRSPEEIIEEEAIRRVDAKKDFTASQRIEDSGTEAERAAELQDIKLTPKQEAAPPRRSGNFKEGDFRETPQEIFGERIPAGERAVEASSISGTTSPAERALIDDATKVGVDFPVSLNEPRTPINLPENPVFGAEDVSSPPTVRFEGVSRENIRRLREGASSTTKDTLQSKKNKRVLDKLQEKEDKHASTIEKASERERDAAKAEGGEADEQLAREAFEEGLELESPPDLKRSQVRVPEDERSMDIARSQEQMDKLEGIQAAEARTTVELQKKIDALPPELQKDADTIAKTITEFARSEADGRIISQTFDDVLDIRTTLFPNENEMIKLAQGNPRNFERLQVELKDTQRNFDSLWKQMSGAAERARAEGGNLNEFSRIMRLFFDPKFGDEPLESGIIAGREAEATRHIPTTEMFDYQLPETFTKIGRGGQRGQGGEDFIPEATAVQERGVRPGEAVKLVDDPGSSLAGGRTVSEISQQRIQQAQQGPGAKEAPGREVRGKTFIPRPKAPLGIPAEEVMLQALRDITPQSSESVLLDALKQLQRGR